ncbi:TIGR03032 family protein [Brevundimonas sp.]|uniref:TIGR03032 family protein n=1 Tax=Brevundimonas sp. TaxID=1871086 RepID=UPI003BACB24A
MAKSSKPAPADASIDAVSGQAPDAPAVAPAVATAAPAGETKIKVSRGFSQWLRSRKASLAFTSYQTGKLFLIGLLPDGKVSIHQQSYERAMGLCAQRERLYLGSLFQVWRLENALAPGDRANTHFDRLYVPRNAQTTGDIDIHELGIDRAGRVIFVNTKFSCLATLSTRYGFTPIWKPPFISRLAAEDRCHLNGLAMHDGVPRYVTAVSRTDVLSGWRERRHEGGVLIDLQTDRIVTDQLSMPHSPRVWNDQVFALDSGRGWLIRVDPQTGKKEDIAFCPGFLRGLALVDGFAVVTLSLPRNGEFKGLELDGAIKSRDGEPWCGLMVIDLRTGDTVEWIKLEGAVTELFDVAVIPDTVCPMAVSSTSAEMRTILPFDQTFGPLNPPNP